MRFGVLGPLAVWTSDERPVRVPEVKVRTLLAHLVVEAGRVVPADRLIDDLWGERLPAHPAGALQTRASQLRRVLEDAEPGGRNLVVSRPPGYLLDVADAAVDAGRFHTLLSRARAATDPRARADLLADALALWRGPALPDFADEEFARTEIVRLSELRLTALEEQADARLQLGEHTPLADELGDLVARHPLRERLRAAHLRALYRAGRQSEALDSYRDLRERLAEELGLDPSPDLTALHQSILEQDRSLSAAPHTPPPTNLPASLSDLIGRSDAVDEVMDLMDRARLVTLTGPGGVGKTRLALEAAHRLIASYPDGAWLVELSGVSGPGPAEAAEVVAAALGVRDVGPADALRTKRMLLVLDNCEHMIGPVAELSTTLLEAAPGLRILATSQRPLGLAGEQLWNVPPLQPAGAVELFVARAAARAPGFTLDDRNAEAVSAICRRLDGIPLALELAATRVRSLGVHELAARLLDSARFQVLTGGYAGAPERQRTLRAMIDWSWELLGEAEQTVLRRLAVHAEGCTLEAAEAVCGDDGLDVLDLLARLVDGSLVVVSEHGDRRRYRLLESVAAYGRERLREAGEWTRIHERHRRYHTEFAASADPRLRGPAQREWLRRLDAENANLRAALESAVRCGDSATALRMVTSLAWYWVLRGRLGEGHRSLGAALSVAGPGDEHAAATARAWRAALTYRLGNLPDPVEPAQPAPRPLDLRELADRTRAEWYLTLARVGIGHGPSEAETELTVFRAIGDQWGTAAALLSAARHAHLRSELTALENYAEQSLSLFSELGDQWGQLHATVALGHRAEIDGDYHRAARLHRHALRMADELGLRTEISDALSQLGRIALLTGDHAQADELHERARAQAAEEGYTIGQEYAELGLALSARRQGRFDVAEAHLRTWLDWDREMNSAIAVSLILAELGFIAEERGEADAARALHTEGLAAARKADDPRAVALATEGLAGVAAMVEDNDEAARLLGAAAALRESVGAPLPPAERGDVDRIAARVRTALDDDDFTASYAVGRDDAVRRRPEGDLEPGRASSPS